MAFEGIPRGSISFYQQLERQNSREWWLAHKKQYDEQVRDPFRELAGALARFGEGKVFRPNRDVRFSADKAPYKTHQGLYVSTNPRCGWYVEVNAEGLRAGGGSYFMDGPQLAAYRRAVLHPVHGPALEGIVHQLRADGYVISGEQLKTRPRGVDEDAPRMDLLRYKSLAAMLELGTPDWMSTPDAAGWIGDIWDEVAPLVEWQETHVGTGVSA